RPDRGYDAIAESILSQSIDALEKKPLPPLAMTQGAAGVAFALNLFLRATGQSVSESPLSELPTTVSAWLEHKNKAEVPLDLMTGVAGFAIALATMPMAQDTEEAARRCLELLEASARHEGDAAWWPRDREDPGALIGLAHGVPGVLVALAHLCRFPALLDR